MQKFSRFLIPALALVIAGGLFASSGTAQAAPASHPSVPCDYAIDVSRTHDNRHTVIDGVPTFVHVNGAHVVYWDEPRRQWVGGDDDYSRAVGAQWYPVTDVHGARFLFVKAPCSTHLLAYEDGHNAGWLYHYAR